MDPLTGARLRPATMDDCMILLEWRNDSQTRESCHRMDEVDLKTHMAWLKSTLENPNRLLYVYQHANGDALGQFRIDIEEGDSCELSWTSAPAARGKGLGKRMVVLGSSMAPKRARAEIKVTSTVQCFTVDQHVAVSQHGKQEACSSSGNDKTRGMFRSHRQYTWGHRALG